MRQRVIKATNKGFGYFGVEKKVTGFLVCGNT